MSPKNEPRTEEGGRAEAVVRLAQAKKFLEVAELVQAAEADIPSSAGVAASLAVLAGIAASDAACFFVLHRRARGQSHAEATRLLGQIDPGGKRAVQSLSRLLDLKDTAHYGIITVTAEKLRVAIRDASHLIELAAEAQTRQ